jgi:molybdopterin converting factor small subunit
MTNLPTTEHTTSETAEIGPPAETETITKLRAEVGELQGELRLRGARDAIVRLLEAAGARSPELLFGTVREKLQFASDGTVENSAALVDHLRRQVPEQFGQPQAVTSIDAGSGAVSARPLTKHALAKMTPEQISQLDWAAVRQVLSQA